MATKSEVNVLNDQVVEKTTKSISLYQSFSDWWNSPSDLQHPPDIHSKPSESWLKNRCIEYRLYRAVISEDVYIKDPSAIEESNQSKKLITAELMDIEIDRNIFIHEFYLENKTNLQCEPIDIVIVHGYMAASGYFLKNYEELVKSKPGARVHAIDLLGFGNSSRPQFPKSLLVDHENHLDRIRQILEVENWFIDAIEKWRLKRNIKKFKLIAHSMGAYLMCCYLMKYNNQYGMENSLVKDFIVVSPMGTEPNYQSLLHDENYQFNHHAKGGDPFEELVAKQNDIRSNSSVKDNSKYYEFWQSIGSPKFPKSYILKLLWRYHVSPFQILQYMGPFYSKILSYWSFKRFSNLIPNDSNTNLINNTGLILKLHSYSYSIFNQFQGSGELAISKLINHEILPYLPLADRGLVEFLAKSNIKTCWIYGDKDWMNSNGGKLIVDKLQKINADSEFLMIENAGHHIYMDNHNDFNDACKRLFML